jgi:3-hydroxyisobutyrate dehydrogenase-like beta-hydroxyacid dehydrogenase
MGSEMARRLVSADYRLVVWNRSPGKAEALADVGASVASTPADAARGADAVITMVADPSALRDVTEGGDGIAAGLTEGTTLVQMSTVDHGALSRLKANLPPEAGLLDAPVLGSISEAREGRLRIFVGGDDAIAERHASLLMALGSPLRVGPLGAGTSAKLVANGTLLGVLALLGESLALAGRLGLSRDAAFEVLAETSLAGQAERRRDAIASGEYLTRFPLRLARKDADLIADEAREAGVDLRLAEAARSWFAEADDAGWAARDYSSVLAFILDR